MSSKKELLSLSKTTTYVEIGERKIDKQEKVDKLSCLGLKKKKKSVNYFFVLGFF